MEIDRKEFLRALESCTPGLSSSENTEQSSAFAFREGKVTTFNDEVQCTQDVEIDVVGAVQARPLLEVLRKLPEDTLKISSKANKLRIKGQGRWIELNMNPDILQPQSPALFNDKLSWKDLPPEFGDALPMVASCAQKGGDNVELSCVHLLPKGMEATDKWQAMRYFIPTGINSPTLVRATTCKSLSGLGIASIAEDETWVHWKTYTGLLLSIRKITGDFVKGLTQVFQAPATSQVLVPNTAEEMINRATPFLEDGANGKVAGVLLTANRMTVRCQNQYGWYEETKDIMYSGPDVQIALNPKYVGEMLKHGYPWDICENMVRIQGHSFVYAVSTGK